MEINIEPYTIQNRRDKDDATSGNIRRREMMGTIRLSDENS